MKKRTKGILIGGAILLFAAAAITGAVVGSIITSKQKREKANANKSPSSQDQGAQKASFEANISLINADYESLNLRVDNLKSTEFKGKMIKVKLVNAQPGSVQSFEQTYTIEKDNVELLFNNLNNGSKYLASVWFEDKEVVSKEFETKLRPKISEASKTSTNAVLNLSDLNKLSKDELQKVEIVIKNKSDSNSEPIVIKVNELEIIGGTARVDLAELDLGLEPGKTYEATVEYKKEGSPNEVLSSPLVLEIPQPANVAFNYSSKSKPKEITIYGLKKNDQKIVLEYRPAGTNVEFVSVTSKLNVTEGKVVVNFEKDLGFDNTYEFKVKYENTEEFLNFENNSQVANFKTEPAPKINVSTSENGLEIKLDSVSDNIDETKLYIRYKDKESNEWKEVLLSEVKNPTTGEIKLPELSANTEYETQLIYKTSSDPEATPTILSVAEFTTEKSFELLIDQSTVASTKVLVHFKDNLFDSKNVENGAYKNIKFKYVKSGTAVQNEFKPLVKNVNNKNFAKVLVEDLEQNTKYFWSLVDENETVLFSGDFKTSKATTVDKKSDNLNAYETKETEEIAIENRLNEGLFVLVKNNFGYFKGDGATKYSPESIEIKYYPEGSENDSTVEKIVVTSNDLISKSMFSKQFQELDNGNYVFEVSYKNGFNSNDELVSVKKSFNVNYKIPEIRFDNTSKQLTINNLEGLNSKNVTVRYSYQNGVKTALTGQVENNSVTFNLKDLKSNTNYDVELEISSEDVFFVSSIENQKRQDFLGEGSNSKLIVSSSFETQEQANVILVKEESISTLFNTVDVKVGLDGFKDKLNKNIKIKIGTAEQLATLNLTDPNAEDPEGVKSLSGTINNEGNFETNDWVRGLPKDTELKIAVYELSEDPASLTKITERDYRTKSFEAAQIQTLEIIGSNTRNPSFKIPNLQGLRDLLSENDQIVFRAQKIKEDRLYREFSNISNPETFTRNGDDLGFGHLVFTKNDFSVWGNQGEAINLRSFISSDANFQTWFEDKKNYQIILTVQSRDNNYVVATTLANKGILFNHNSPEIIENETSHAISAKQENSKEYAASITFKLRNLADFVSTATPENTLKGYYIKTDDLLASADPQNWHLMGNVTVESAQSGNIAFTGLETNTNYNFAFLDKDNNLILEKKRVKTISKPKLRNTTYGDTIMRYTLSDVKGASSLLPDGTYTIKYSTDKTFANSSNSVTIGGDVNLANYEGSFVFTLETNLLPNTTYNYKLVNAEGQVVLGYEGIFKTNESQSADKRVGTDYAVVNLKNPSFTLREGFYSIARKDPQQEGKMLLDTLKLEYSTTQEFTPETTKEFSVSLSENESKLLSIRINNLNPDTKYFYRLVKGTIRSNVIKNTRTAEENSAPEVNYETSNPVMLGSFTTLPIMNEGDTTSNSAKLIFNKPANIQNDDELFLRYKRIDSSKEYLVEYNYVIENDKVIFDLQNLNSNNYYEYLLSGTDFTEYSRGEFSTKNNNSLNVRLIKIGEFLRRIEIDNADDYSGQKVRISYKESTASDYNSVDVVITPENNKFLWDLDNFKELKTYNYKVELLNSSNEPYHLLQEGVFDVERPYAAGDQRVTTNVRTYGNYDLNKWYTITNLQEIYANNLNWKQRVKETLQEVAIFGTEVSEGNAYAWHNLIHDGNKKQYAEETSDGLVYSYLFNDNGKLKGLKFEIRLIGNAIQVKVIEAKVKSESVEPILLVDKFQYSDLNENLMYKATGGLINQGQPSVLGTKFINISGFKFKAQRERMGSKDFSVPQIFRYSVEESTPALNQLTPSLNNNSVGAFVNLNNPKQKAKYGSFEDGVHNYNVLYNAYASKDNNLLPFNANFLVSASSYPDFAYSNSSISVPGFEGNDRELRNKFFKSLLENGKIRFTGADTKNKNWISFNSSDILLFDDEEYAYSEKYEMELPVKRLIWRDGNSIKGIRIALNDAKRGNGAVLGQFDDFIYVKEVALNESLENLTWSKFVESASKQTTSSFMNPDSPGSAIGGISFVSKDRMFINDSYRKYNNFSSDNLAPKFLYEANVVDETTTTRIVKMSNYDVGTYKIKIQYLTYFGNLTDEQISNEQNVVIDESNKSFVSVDLSEKLKYNGKYKILLLNDQNVELNSATGDNYQSPDGVFVIPDIRNLNSGAHPGNDAYASTSGWLGYYLDRLFGFERAQYSEWYTRTKETLKYGLIGSTKFNDSPEVSRKWGKAVFYKDLPGYSGHPLFLFAALSDDNTKVIITELLLEPTDGNANNIISVYSSAKLFALEENDPKTLEGMTDQWIKNKFERGANPTNLEKVRVLSSSSNPNKTALLGLYFENPRGVKPTTVTSESSSTGSNGSGTGA